MSSVSDGGHHHEIIIVRHGGGDHDEGHHGGVWKIAFADFMTAMMCFFLVMWLINAANEQTKSAVASYFNPVKLIDRNSSRKGLEDIGTGPNAVDASEEKPETPSDGGGSKGPESGGAAEGKDTTSAVASEKDSDERLFSDPYAVLAEIAANTDTRQNISEKGDGGADAAGPASGASGGASYRDPFAPDFWSQQVQTNDKAEDDTLEIDTRSKKAARADKQENVDKKKSAGKQESPEIGKDEPAPAADKAPEPAVEPTKDKAEPTVTAKAAAKQIAGELATALGKDKLDNGISVTATDKGVSISVTDELDFGMFEIGSALPRRDLVLAMEKIGKVLADHKGTITINGHTDARPFKSEKYDNWRLSSARAQSAYYMITRSGLDERRIVEVSGFADRQLKNTADPLAPENRRIEILLETGG